MRLLCLLQLAHPSSIFAQTPSRDSGTQKCIFARTVSIDENSTSQTFQDYKVIKEIWLDKEWRSWSISVKSGRARLREAKAEGAKLDSQLLTTQHTLKQREASDGGNRARRLSHWFRSIDFNKAAFPMAIAIIAGLVVLIVLIVGRLKMVNHEVKEKTEAFDRITMSWKNTNTTHSKSRLNFPGNYKTNATGYRKCAAQKCNSSSFRIWAFHFLMSNPSDRRFAVPEDKRHF